ncbi:hypothetical protein BV898_11768 [Hypsibius exemplaris]|uniref:G-protein coupled receptors family 1 profile domain-containing protein n=1 Tax=Hypsibius exemplaris TaxID=2072580 RepID=A0A1W0WFK4_HYPEX|nr:hypothetical protein BV898_11768 [Hypsibius exemplaris]
MSPSNATAITASNKSLANCTLSSQQNHTLNVLPIILGVVTMLSQLFNLTIFRFWHQKEPFVSLHVLLAFCSLLVGAFGIITPVIRLLPWREPLSVTFTNLAAISLEFIHTQSLVTLVAISVDRWLSVEFPGPYRFHISRRKMRWAIGLSWVVTMVLTLPGFVVYWADFQAFCNRPVGFVINSAFHGRQIWAAFHGPVILCFLLLFQARIVVIAVTVKLRAHLARRRPAVAEQAPRATVVQLVWGSLRASMIILFVGLLADLPFALDIQRLTSSSTVLRILYMLPILQHIYSPVVYLLFFSQFRAVLVRALTFLARSFVEREQRALVPIANAGFAVASADSVPTDHPARGPTS